MPMRFELWYLNLNSNIHTFFFKYVKSCSILFMEYCWNAVTSVNRCECRKSESSTHCVPKTPCNSLMNPQGFKNPHLGSPAPGVSPYLMFCSWSWWLCNNILALHFGYRTDCCCVTPCQSRQDILTFALTIQQQSSDRLNGWLIIKIMK